MTRQKDISKDPNYIPILDHGFVGLVDSMPQKGETDGIANGDAAIVQAARVSYGKGTKKVSQDRGLIRYLMRQRHSSPFEMVDLKFHCKMPIFVARQWVRHRVASLNEYSGRYSEMTDEFYIPAGENIKPQSSTNKQGREGELDGGIIENFIFDVEEQTDVSYEIYKGHLEDNISRELARINLPLNNYTEWYWKINLHNLFHFISLRSDPHAQWEIQQYSNAMLQLIREIAPFAVEAFEDYHMNGIHLSKQEKDLVDYLMTATPISGDELIKNGWNKRELEELRKKFKNIRIV